MKPTVTDQLRQTRRILRETIHPCLKDEHPALILDYLILNLEMLETAWSRVLPFLHWDNTESLALLGKLRGPTDAALAAEIARVTEAPSCDPFDVEAVEQRNLEIRAAIERCVASCDGADLAAIRAHLSDRISRYPMRPKALPPSGASAAKAN